MSGVISKKEEKIPVDFYVRIYDSLYKEGYIRDNNSSHLFDPRYPTAGLVFLLDQAGIEYSSVLDVGCGRGNGLLELSKKVKKIAGIDISRTAVEIAKSKGLQVKQGSVIEIPYEEDSFDLVTSTDVLEHLLEKDITRAALELKRVTKKYLGLKIAPSPERGANKLLEKLRKKGVVPQDINNLHLTVKPIDFWRSLFEEELRMNIIAEKVDRHPNPEIGIHGYRLVLEKSENF